MISSFTGIKEIVYIFDSMAIFMQDYVFIEGVGLPLSRVVVATYHDKPIGWTIISPSREVRIIRVDHLNFI